MRPIIRWAGGKRRLLPKILAAAPSQFRRYHEPFLGGGAVLLSLYPAEASASDCNPELINFYEQVVTDHEAVHAAFCTMQNTKETYLRVRSTDRSPGLASVDPTTRAARFLYLNKASFQGLYRVNSSGQHNVPYGRPKALSCDVESLASFASAVKHVRFATCDFESALQNVQRGDFVYLDPPYVPTSDTSGFTCYAADGFGLEQQRRLRDCCEALDSRGAMFLQSNSSCDTVMEMYRGLRIDTVPVRRSIAAKPEVRRTVDEVLIRNY